MHNLQLTEDQNLILETVRKFVQESLAPVALDRDEHRQFLGEQFAGLAELGLFGLAVAEDAGGAGMGFVPLAVVMEELGTQSGSLARLLIGQVQAAMVLADAGADALAGVLTGEVRAVFVGPEHGLVLDGGTLRGKAELVPGAGEANLLVVAARQAGKLQLCTVDAGACKRTALRALGFASTAPARVEFASPAAVIASGEAAERAVARAEVAAWVGGAAACVGMGIACCTGARRHASERIAFGKPLLVQQAVVRKLVEARRGLDAARHLAFHAARLFDAGADAAEVAMQARIAAVDAAVLAADEAIQIHGGFGYVVEYHVERHYRDAKNWEVLDGGNDRLRDRLGARQYA